MIRGREIAALAATPLAIGVAIFVVGLLSVGYYTFFAPMWADAEREVFEESQSYQHGVVRELRNLQLEYERAEAGSSERRIIRSTVLHRAGPLDRSDLPSDVRAFVTSIERQQ